jgi:hypothetical protein
MIIGGCALVPDIPSEASYALPRTTITVMTAQRQIGGCAVPYELPLVLLSGESWDWNSLRPGPQRTWRKKRK